MAYQLKYKPGASFAVAEITALLSEQIVEPILQELAARTRIDPTRGLLIDLRDVPGVLGPTEHYLMGLAVAKHLGHLEKVATVVPRAKITRVSEEAAQEQGMQLRVFDSLQKAQDWLVR
jgi:hypothetical protein